MDRHWSYRRAGAVRRSFVAAKSAGSAPGDGGQLVATINGTPVYSDKSLTSIHNTRVDFSDGSWCDVATGEVSNRGPGYISFEARPSKAGSGNRANKIKTDTFPGRSLEVRNLTADLDIRPYDGKEVEVTREGAAGLVDDIRPHASGDAVVVESGGRGSAPSVNVGTVHTSVITGSNRISVHTGQATGKLPKVTVRVPKGLPVSVSNVYGQTTIGDTGGPLTCESSGSGDVTAGSVGATTIKLQGSGNVTVGSVSDVLNVSVQGSGDVAVGKGTIKTLAVTTQGSGNVAFGGSAIDARLSTSGSGDITGSHVTNRPKTSILGSGDIKVGNWEADPDK
jgi:hypothetical protein